MKVFGRICSISPKRLSCCLTLWVKRDPEETVARTKVWALMVPCQRAALPLTGMYFLPLNMHKVVNWSSKRWGSERSAETSVFKSDTFAQRDRGQKCGSEDLQMLWKCQKIYNEQDDCLPKGQVPWKYWQYIQHFQMSAQVLILFGIWLHFSEL